MQNDKPTRSRQSSGSPQAPLTIKRYASRRLYNTETSDYVTLEEIAAIIRTGREVRIVDLKSGDDLPVSTCCRSSPSTRAGAKASCRSTS